MSRNVITLIFTMKKAGLWNKNMDLIQAAEIPRALYSVIFSCSVALPVPQAFCFCMRIYRTENAAGVWKRITAASFC